MPHFRANPKISELIKQELKPNNQWLKSLLLTTKTPDLKMPARKPETHALKTHAELRYIAIELKPKDTELTTKTAELKLTLRS